MSQQFMVNSMSNDNFFDRSRATRKVGLERPTLAFSFIASFTEVLMAEEDSRLGLAKALESLGRRLGAIELAAWQAPNTDGRRLECVASWSLGSEPVVGSYDGPSSVHMSEFPSSLLSRLLAGEAVAPTLDLRIRALLGLPEGTEIAWAPIMCAGSEESHLEGFIYVARDAETASWTASELSLIRSAGSVTAMWFERLGRSQDVSSRASELDLILQNVEETIFRADTTGNFTYLNASWGRIMGIPERECIGRSLVEFVDPTDQTEFVSRFVPLLSEEVTFCRVRVRLVTSAGDSRWVDLFARRLYDEAGRFLGVTGTMRDMSEERWEHHFRQERARDEGMRRLASSISHEINNILQATLISLELACEDYGVSPEDLEDSAMGDVLSGLERMREVSHELNAFAKGSHREDPIDLTEAISAATENVRAVNDRATVSVDPGTELWMAQGDLRHVTFALEHLIRNALESSPAPRVNVSALNASVSALDVGVTEHGLVPGDYACVFVRDTGPGMEDSELERALEPFVSTKPGHRGMGLSVAQAVASSHGGALIIRSNPGRGTSIALYLPRHPDSEVEGSYPGRDMPIQGARVLIADDEPRVRATLSRALKRLGYVVETVDDGEAALDMLEQSSDYDAVIFDYIMPGLHGVPLLERARLLRPDLPMLVCTGDRLGAQAVARAFHDIPILLKPYTISQIRATLTELMQS